MQRNLPPQSPIWKRESKPDRATDTANSADNVPSAKAIAKGLAAGHSSKPGYWLHVCGTGMLMHHDKALKRYGQAPAAGELYHDIDDIDRILHFADEALHRDVDKVVLGSNNPAGASEGGGGVRTLIVSPPCIYGAGRGPGNRRSVQVNRLAALTLARGGRAPVQRPGLTEWDHVHVRDLSAFFVLAVEAAASSSSSSGNDPEIFGERGYFFLESGSHRWSDVARWVADSAARQGFVPEGQARVEEVDDFYFFGMNARSVAARARRYLGWKPVAPGLREEIDGIVAVEAEVLKNKKEEA